MVIQLREEFLERAFDALRRIDYHPAVPVTARQLSDPEMRERLRTSNNKEVLRFWSELHRETPLGVFVSEPLIFDEEYDLALEQEFSAGHPCGGRTRLW